MRAPPPAPDPNIDFRRTGVLDVFLFKYAQTLTTDTSDKAAWQGGDIVVFENPPGISAWSPTSGTVTACRSSSTTWGSASARTITFRSASTWR